MPYRCPVCFGAGMVASNFYTKADAAASVEQPLCRSCGGTGIVWSPRIEITSEHRPWFGEFKATPRTA